MWIVETLIAADDNGNFVTLVSDKITLNVNRDNLKICRVFDIKETPPCLQIAVNDLIKQLHTET